MMINVAFLDVFHGDCIVVTFDELDNKKACIVIDGGEKKEAAKRLAKYLKYEKIEVIDLLIATHIDADHINGLIHLFELYSKSQDSWNLGNEKCIRNYWGPKPDPDYSPSQIANSSDYTSEKYSGRQTQTFITQSVKQNQDLNTLIENHIIESSHIYHPSLNDTPPLNLFQNVSLELLAPDIQILDTDIKKNAMTTTNVPYLLKRIHGDPDLPQGRLTLYELRRILDINAEEMAKIANRTANNQSLVVKLIPKASNSKSWSFLFTGDAEHESWDMMRSSNEIKPKLHSKILKVPHHGSKNGIDKESFEEIKPEFSIISVGQKHGLPDSKTLRLIKSKDNSKLFCTERNNSVSHRGACLDKNSCVRKSEEEFRNIRFNINCDSGDVAIQTFVIENQEVQFDSSEEQIWCPVNNWLV